MIQYVLINKETLHVASALEIPEEDGLTWHYPTDEFTVVASDFFFDPKYDYADYVYNPDSGEFSLDKQVETVEFFDLASGETKTLTSEDIDAMVEDKVKNQVEAVLSEMIASANLDPKILAPDASSVITM